jgi:hypothetical protein
MKKFFAAAVFASVMPFAASADYLRQCSVSDIQNDVGVCAQIQSVTPLQPVTVCVAQDGVVDARTNPSINCRTGAGTQANLGGLSPVGSGIAIVVAIAAIAAAADGGTNGTN